MIVDDLDQNEDEIQGMEQPIFEKTKGKSDDKKRENTKPNKENKKKVQEKEDKDNDSDQEDCNQYDWDTFPNWLHVPEENGHYTR